MRRRDVALAIAVAGLSAIALREYIARDAETPPPAIEVPAEGPIVVMAAGDVLLTEPLDLESDALQGVRSLLSRATLVVANLDMTLLDDAAGTRARPGTGWPFGTAREARTLRRLGINVLSLANNHGADYGPENIAAVRGLLRNAGIESAGAGRDLSEARAPVFVGSERRVAFVAVTASTAPEARATDPTPSIEGRAGVNALRYTATITADSATFESLSESLSVLQAGPPARGDTLTFFGTPIRRGERTSVEFVVDDRDQEGMLAVVGAAKASAELVVVSLHAHEPANASPEPAEFVRSFARAAIDRGAGLVFGHGPHRVRGVELYGQGAIVYSLGNFVYRARDIAAAPADMYDAGADLYEAAVSGQRAEVTKLDLENPFWWQGAVAETVFEQGRLVRMQLHAIDLGGDKPLNDRGVPTVFGTERAAGVFQTVDQLSRPWGTMVDPETGQVRASPDVRPQESPTAAR